MKAIVLLSGGIDSTIMLAKAVKEGREVTAISFDYGQRNFPEIKAAINIAEHYDVNHRIIKLDSNTFDKSSLVHKSSVPKGRTLAQINNGTIPSTYVPARNTLFLAYAASQAEILEANEIYFGANAADQIPYPDTRPAYLQAFQAVLNLATKQAAEGNPPKLLFPLIKLQKHDIIKLGHELKAPLKLSISCYDPHKDGTHCGCCDACYLRKEGFIAAGVEDPTKYVEGGVPLEAIDLISR
jgi:7-cyano-7-deazaguanine synthase